jgi:hypothetical protein
MTLAPVGLEHRIERTGELGVAVADQEPGSDALPKELAAHVPWGRFQLQDERKRARFVAYAFYVRSAEAASLRTWATGALAGQGPITPARLVALDP